ncbi:MAG: ComF family protein [Fibrobacter sp.]|nr:ComF family protein [Fibrobacter sp.]
MNIIRHLEGFVFGAECLGCGKPSSRLDPWLCADCANELDRLSKIPTLKDDDVFCLYPMRNLTRKMVHALKYHSIPGMASYLIKHSSAKKNGLIWQEITLLPKPLYFVPVPLHRARYRERGYNQAEKIAAALASIYQGRVARFLKRKTFVVSQTKLSRAERAMNVEGAFEAALPKEGLASGTVIVVDDVFTTGATTFACVSALGKLDVPIKVCTLLYEEAVTAAADFAADCRMEWEFPK